MSDATTEYDSESRRMTLFAAGVLLVLDVGLVALGEHLLHEHLPLGVVFYVSLALWTMVNLGVVITVAYMMRRSFSLRDKAIREVNDRLMTTTEELEVANEELQTRAEELESSNEELLVTTEDLSRVNATLETRAKELETARAAAAAGQSHRDAILAAVPDCMLILNADRRLTMVNPAFRRWLGRADDAIRGKQPEEIPELAPICRGALSEEIEQSLATGSRSRFSAVEFGEGEGRRVFDIEIIGFRAHSSPEALILMEDVTERALLHAKDSLLAALVEASGEAVIGLDHEGQIISWNPAATSLFGHDAASILGKPAKDLLPDEKFHAQLRKLAPNGVARRVTFETAGAHASGRNLVLRLCVTQLGSTGNGPFGYAVIAHDVRALKRAEKEHETTTEVLRLLARGIQ